MHCVGCSQLDETERPNWRNHLLVHWQEKKHNDYSHNTVNVNICVLIKHPFSPFVQHNKVDSKYCNIEDDGKQDECKSPSKKVLCNVHLVPGNMRKRAVKPPITTNDIGTSKLSNILLFTSGRLISPRSLHRSQIVFSPTRMMTNRPTNFTPKAPARFIPVSTNQSHQEALKDLEKEERKEKIQ